MHMGYGKKKEHELILTFSCGEEKLKLPGDFREEDINNVLHSDSALDGPLEQGPPSGKNQVLNGTRIALEGGRKIVTAGFIESHPVKVAHISLCFMGKP